MFSIDMGTFQKCLWVYLQVRLIFLAGRTLSKLEDAINKLKSEGIDAEAFSFDASDRESTKRLASYSSEQGNVKTVIHCAGISPNMADAKKIFEINELVQ